MSMKNHTAEASGFEAVSSVSLSLFSRAVANLRAWSADHALRRQLCEMDASMLRDIGISEDEIHRVRNRERFTPRAWR
jgi:uncharacterized protein YjiS (DUF1127 family)